MATLEQVEKLRAKVNCTYEEASAALDACDGDLLDAIIYLEKRGKQSESSGGSYSTKGGDRQEREYESHSTTHTTYTRHDSSFGESMNRFFVWLGKIIKRGNENYLDVINNGKIMLSIPMTALVLLFLFAFYFMIPAMLIGLVCGLKFQFRGQDFENTKANEYSQKASETADKIKRDVKNGMKNDEASNTKANADTDKE